MQKLVVLFVVLFLLFITSCSNSESSDKNKKNLSSNSVVLPKQKYDSLLFESRNTQYLREDLEKLNGFILNLKKCPTFSLIVLDMELDSVEKGAENYGSFTDFFVPTLHDAINAGVSKGEIEKRINRLIRLAKKGKFLSSYERGLFEEGGEKAIRNYIM